MKFNSEIIKKLPKAELHCHLDGSLRLDTIIELSKKQGLKLPSDNKYILKVDSIEMLCYYNKKCNKWVPIIKK